MRLDTELYKDEIMEMYSRGMNANEIRIELGWENHQPIYNFFKKYHLEHKQRVWTRQYTLDEDYFYEINSEDKAYILGFICADGYVGKDRLNITISIKDIDILDKIKIYVKSNQILSFTERLNPYLYGKEYCEMVGLQLSSHKLVKPLIQMGLSDNKTYTLNSSILKYIPDLFIRDFLRGYFDGDGNIMWGKRYDSGIKYNINICGNEKFLLNTYQVYFPSSNKMYFEKRSKQTFIWKLSSKENVRNFLSYLYLNSNIYLNRKYEEYLKSNMLI